MAMRSFTQWLDGILLEGTPEAEGRWAISARAPGQGRIRIGLLLGGNRRYVAETIGRSARQSTTTTKAAALRWLLDWACAQSGGKTLAAADATFQARQRLRGAHISCSAP